MLHDPNSVAELFDRIERKAPAYIDLLTANTDEEFEAAFVVVLDVAVHHLTAVRLTEGTISA